MAQPVQATDFLQSPETRPPGPVSVLFGEDRFLKGQVLARLREALLGEGDGAFSFRRFDGPTAAFAEVLEELSTVAMFGGGRRLVVVDDAEPFVTAYRAQLERYVDGPRRTGHLVLQVKSWPATTRLYQRVAEVGLAVECRSPTGGRLASWLRTWASPSHGVQLTPSAAGLLVEMIGPELGLLDQELAKLAVHAGAGKKVDEREVLEVVGTWRARSVWEMIDAALAGKAEKALVELDRLLLAGENPVGVLGQIAATLRRLAAATHIVVGAERAGRRVTLAAALAQAGVPPFLRQKAQSQLRRLGRERGLKLYQWLLEADLDMKGASYLPLRVILERLVIRLAMPVEARRPVPGTRTARRRSATRSVTPGPPNSA